MPAVDLCTPRIFSRTARSGMLVREEHQRSSGAAAGGHPLRRVAVSLSVARGRSRRILLGVMGVIGVNGVRRRSEWPTINQYLHASSYPQDHEAPPCCKPARPLVGLCDSSRRFDRSPLESASPDNSPPRPLAPGHLRHRRENDNSFATSFSSNTILTHSIPFHSGQEILREYNRRAEDLFPFCLLALKQSACKNQTRVASFNVCEQLDADCNVDDETVAESELRQRNNQIIDLGSSRATTHHIFSLIFT